MAEPTEMDVAAFDLILSNLLEVMTGDHGPCTGHLVLGGMYLAVELMKDDDLRPIVEKAMELPPDLQRIRNSVSLFRENLVDNPTGLPTVPEDRTRVYVIPVGEITVEALQRMTSTEPDDDEDDGLPGDPHTTFLDGL